MALALRARARACTRSLWHQTCATIHGTIDQVSLYALSLALAISLSLSHSSLQPLQIRCISLQDLVRRDALRGMMMFITAGPSTKLRDCSLIVGLFYLQRLKDFDPDGKPERNRLTSYNIQRLLFTALMLASTFLDEPHASNNPQTSCAHCARPACPEDE